MSLSNKWKQTILAVKTEKFDIDVQDCWRAAMAHINAKRNEANKIRADWSQPSHVPSEAEIKTAALLAWEGRLTSVEWIYIDNINITDIPQDQMENLTSIVTWRVGINNMSHAIQLCSILASVQCTLLWLENMELSEEETQALVTTMRDRVKCVMLYNVTLYIEELTLYDGQGHCRELCVGRDTRDRYGDRLRLWAENKGWTVTWDSDLWLVMERK